MAYSLAADVRESKRDAELMREGLCLYDENEGIRSFCVTFSMSRYQYAHEYCLMVYRGSPAVTYASGNTNRALSLVEMATAFGKNPL